MADIAATIAKLATSTAAPQSTGERQARNWFECSKRKLAQHIQRGTFSRSAAVSLLRQNARDFAKLANVQYDDATLSLASDMLCDYVITINATE